MTSTSSHMRKISWTIWVIASVFYAYQYILRVMPNIMLSDIMTQFGIDAATFGQFSGVYYIGYSLMHLPLGILLDRYGPKKVLTGCILLSVAGLMPLLFADYWLYPIMGRLLIGIGSSGAILGVFKIIRMTFSEERFPRMLSISVMIGLIGAIYGGGPVSYMHSQLGYRMVIELFAIGGVMLALATYLIVPQQQSSEQGTVLSGIREVLSNRRVVFSCLFAGLLVGALEGFADVWATAFLKQVYGFDGTLSASLPSLIFIGMCFGAPVLSLVAEKAGSYLATIVGAGVVMTLSFVLMLTFALSSEVLSGIFVLIGVCSAYQILAIYKASTYVADSVAGLTTAVANMIIMIFGYAFHTAIGTVVSAMGGPATSLALEYGVAVIPMASLVGTAGFAILLAKEKQDQKAAATE